MTELSYGRQDTAEQRAIPDEVFPTTPELVSRGAEAYKAMLERISDQTVLEALINNRRIQNCFLGLTPEVFLNPDDDFSDVSEGTWQDLLEVIHQQAPFLAPFSYSYIRDEGTEDEQVINCLSFINLDAGQRVITQHSELFPQYASENPQDWLLNHPEEWLSPDGTDESEVRYGLLSGFPVWSVQQYPAYREVLDTMMASLKEEEVDEMLMILRTENPSEDSKDEIRQEIATSVPGLLPEMITIFLSHKPVTSAAAMGYVGFDEEKDHTYITQLERFYSQSGIEATNQQIAEKYQLDYYAIR